MTSILPLEMNGVIFLTGKRGVGKSFLASQFENPKRVIFFDFEEKAEGIHQQLQFGKYVSVTRNAVEKGGSPLVMWDIMASEIANIPQDAYTTAVIDNVSMLELALRAEASRNVKTYVKDYGLNLVNVESGRFGGLSSVINFLVSEKVCAPLRAKGVRAIVVTSHIKPRWGSNGIIPNKVTSKGADRWQELSILTLILVSAEHAPIPSAIVQKEQLGQIEYDATTGEFIVKRRLPYRIPRCTGSEIRGYLTSPADIHNPKSGESVDLQEFDPYREELSQEQIAFAIKMFEAQEREERLARDAEIEMQRSMHEEMKQKVAGMRANGDSLPQIANELGITVPEVAKFIE